MVKSVIGDETQLKSLENRLFQTSIPAQVGIVVGKLNPKSDRAFVYDLIPTPPTDGGGPPMLPQIDRCRRRRGGGRDKKKKGGSVEPPPSLSIDADWVVDHARQDVDWGMHVVRVYVRASEALYNATSPSLLSQTFRGVAQAAPWYERESDERLLIHISYGPSRWVCESVQSHLPICNRVISKWGSCYLLFKLINACIILRSGKGSDPEWNETFVFTVSEGTSELTVKLMDSDTVTEDDFKQYLQKESVRPTVYNVVKDQQLCGEIKVGLTFTPEATRGLRS